ncbi:MAG: amino acid permease [Candidatus Neomarinimicrobiota bacterium]|nr:amino acid permease [Candidatus Neomarinimicrobiota bacterium]
MSESRLRRDLGPVSGYATIVGILIGAGIFRVTGEAGAVAGSAVPFAYLLFTPIVLATALAYSIFSSTPLGRRPGGAYIHISRTFGNYYIGFVAMWMKLVAFVGAISFMSTSFGEYMNYFIPGQDPRIWGVVVLATFYGINIFGIKYYGRIQIGMLVILIFSILLLVIPGLAAVDLSFYDPLLPKGWGGLLGAMPILFFSYAGFETLAQTAGETKDATRTLPTIFIRGVLASVIIFFLMSFVAFGVLPAEVLAESDSAMADVAAQYLPPWGAAAVALGAMCAFLTSINGSILVPSRMFFVFSEDRLMPTFLSAVHPKWRTPHISLIISAAICTGLIWTQSSQFLLNTGLIGIFIVYFLQGVALAFLPKVNRPLYESALFRPPQIVVSCIGLFTATVMLIFMIAILKSVLVWTLIWLTIGSLLFFVGRQQGRISGFDYDARLEKDLVMEE